MSQSERKEALLDNIGLQEGDSVFVIGCETGEIIDYCLTHNAKLVVGVDTNLLNIETMKERFLQMKNVEIAFWDSSDNKMITKNYLTKSSTCKTAYFWH